MKRGSKLIVMDPTLTWLAGKADVWFQLRPGTDAALALALCDQHLLFDSYGFEGGSFRGATRVAALDPKLWCELFWANKETLANLTDELTERLAEYSALLHGDDRAALLERLTVSSDRKKKFDALRGLDASQKPLFK